MIIRHDRCWLLLLLMLAPAVQAQEDSGLWNGMKQDARNFYAADTWILWAEGLVAGGLLANTSADENIQDWYQDEVRSGSTDDISEWAKPFGNGFLVVPLYVLATLIGSQQEAGAVATVGDWGARSLRATVVGAVPMLAFQRLLGAGRPIDDDDSDWDPLNDSNGVSGHAFIGSIPFLTAAQMVDSTTMKSMWYVGSILTGLSRFNDDDHYLSQVILGWWMGYLSVASVTEFTSPHMAQWFQPALIDGRAGMQVSMDF